MTRVDLVRALYVAVGGAAGSAARFLVGTALEPRVGTVFPITTLLINISGSVLLGFIARYGADSAALSPELRLLLTVGVCGGYTTFSAFSLETVRLIEGGGMARAALYAAASVVLCVAGAWMGAALAAANR